MTVINIEDLKRWRANRIQAGNCNHDDMTALGAFIDNVEKIERITCKECKYAHMTYGGDCKYCDIWKDDDDFCLELYLDGDFYCSYGERKESE